MQQSFANYILVKINLSGKTIKIFGNSNNKTRTHKHFKHTRQTKELLSIT